MKTEIEEVFFKAFEQSGVVDNCIDWMREMYDLGFLPKGGRKLPEQLERYYNETLPNKIRDATEAFDDTVINSLIEEIKSNLDECQNEAQRERYLFSLLKPFKGLSNVYHPVAQINSLQVLIEDCKRHKAMWESLPRDQIPFNVAGGQSGTPKEQIEACDDMATNYQKRIDRLHYISRRFCEVIGGQINEKNSVEWCLEKFVNVWSVFADRLDALLLERTEFKTEHRSLIWLQRECGIYLKLHRSITDVDYYLGSMELARKYISEVHGVEFTEIQQVQEIQQDNKSDDPAPQQSQADISSAIDTLTANNNIIARAFNSHLKTAFTTGKSSTMIQINPRKFTAFFDVFRPLWQANLISKKHYHSEYDFIINNFQINERDISKTTISGAKNRKRWV